jgi:hypothetical protein
MRTASSTSWAAAPQKSSLWYNYDLRAQLLLSLICDLMACLAWPIRFRVRELKAPLRNQP